MKNLIIIWLIDGVFFLAGICLIRYSNKITSWWLKQHKQITDKIGIDMFQPTDDYKFNYKMGPVMFRILGIISIGFSIALVFVVLFL